MIRATHLGDIIYFDSFDEAKKYYNHEEAEDIDELNEILKKEYDGMVSPMISEIELEYLIHRRPDEEVCDFIDNAKTWDSYEVQKSINYLCEKYDIPLKDDLGEWRYAEDVLTDIKKAISK